MRAGSSHDLPADYTRQRARFLRHVIDDGQCPELDAEDLVSRWERQAAKLRRAPGSTSYWRDAWVWIGRQVGADAKPPKRDMNARAPDGQVYGG